MQIDYREREREHGTPPVNYRIEMMVSDRVRYSPKAKWFRRTSHETEIFPPLMVTKEWSDQEKHDLCQRYIQRQSPRLLMLHGLWREVRERLEISAKAYAMEVARFHKLYPDIVHRYHMTPILVEAPLRAAA